MTDEKIFELMMERIGMDQQKIGDYRPCNQMYMSELGIPTIYNAITVETRQGDTVIYIPKTDVDGNDMERERLKITLNSAAGIPDGGLHSVSVRYQHIYRVTEDNADTHGSDKEKYIVSRTELTTEEEKTFAECLDKAKESAEYQDTENMLNEAIRQFEFITNKTLIMSEYPFAGEFTF